MTVSYAKSYIDRAYDARDIFTLYHVISTLEANRDLPEVFELFMRLWEWCCSTRSGVWQYYEIIPLAEFHKTADMMKRHNLGEITERFLGGMENWQEPEYCGDLDDWIEDNQETIAMAAMTLIEEHRDYLYPVK